MVYSPIWQLAFSLLLTSTLQSTASPFATALSLPHFSTAALTPHYGQNDNTQAISDSITEPDLLPVLPVLPWQYKLDVGGGIFIDLTFGPIRRPLSPTNLKHLLDAALAKLTQEKRAALPNYSPTDFYPLKSGKQTFFQGARPEDKGLYVSIQNVKVNREFTWQNITSVLLRLKSFLVGEEKSWECTFSFRNRYGVLATGRIQKLRPDEGGKCVGCIPVLKRPGPSF
ncbi:MAG: hypothetical protein Q9221_001833 [Calogaya cf. arnoldii]